MELVQECMVLKELIPIASVALGAVIGLLATFVSSKYIKDRESNLALEVRERERVEKIYRLSVQIKQMISDNYMQCVKHILEDEDFQDNLTHDFPPLLELKMLISLYVPSLKREYEALLSSIHNFTNEMMSCRFKNYTSESDSVKKIDVKRLFDLDHEVDKSIKEIRSQLQALVKV